MASDEKFMEYVADQLSAGGMITYRKMFGEYGIYCNGIYFAAVCDNKLFIKPTQAGRLYIGKPVESPPYPGAKNHFLIEEKLEDRDWLGELVRITVKSLPPKKKRKK
jgi:TfoX/Sxy family transcriptional regulator of competence genes